VICYASGRTGRLSVRLVSGESASCQPVDSTPRWKGSGEPFDRSLLSRDRACHPGTPERQALIVSYGLAVDERHKGPQASKARSSEVPFNGRSGGLPPMNSLIWRSQAKSAWRHPRKLRPPSKIGKRKRQIIVAFFARKPANARSPWTGLSSMTKLWVVCVRGRLSPGWGMSMRHLA
jgi:hypothetical protein